MQLSKKQKHFYDFFFIFKIYFKFWTFFKKEEPHSWCITEITDSEKRG